MDFTIPEELLEFKNLARILCEKHLKPIVLELDKNHEYPRNFLSLIGKQGFMGVWLPEEYGGMGQGVLSLALVTEEISRVCTGTSAAYGAIALGALPILLSGTEEQKQKYITKIAAGECIASFAITESGSGSDAFNMQTRAVRDGDYYVLNGEKQFITNAGEADICVLFAKTPQSGQVAGFILERGMPGFSVSPKRRKMGLHCSDTRDIALSDCRVHKDNLLGGNESTGLLAVLVTFPRSRIIVGAQGVGLAKGVFANAWAYAEQTRRFGKKVNEFQNIQHDFANMELLIETAQNSVYKAAWFVDRGVKTAKERNEMVRLASIAKLHGADAAFEVANKAVDICAGSGYMHEHGTEKFLRDAKALQIYEGTRNIQLNHIFSILSLSRPKK